jgi:hypothetical protein
MGPIQRAIRRAVNPASTAFARWWQLAVMRRPRVPRLVLAGGRDGRTAVALPGPRTTGRRRGAVRQGPVEQEVLVPDVVGLRGEDARDIGEELGLFVRGPDPDGAPLAELGSSGGVVVRQHPDPGLAVARGSELIVWIERPPGSAGVREPRRPLPRPTALRGEADEPTGP